MTSSNSELLELVKQRILSEMVCPLKDSATNLVFGKGNPESRILFIGEAPGKNEDLQGEPFVGSAGKQLDGLLNTVGLSLGDVYIANILKYRPPENRQPTTEEIKRHTPYLVEQISIIQPEVIVTLGNYATKFVLAHFDPDGMKTIAGISSLHGKPQHHTINGKTYTIIPMYHPAALLYKRALTPIIEEDYTTMKEELRREREHDTTVKNNLSTSP